MNRSELTPKELCEKDEYGLYIHADNYQNTRANIIAFEKFEDREELNKIPMWVRRIFKAV